MDVEYVPPSVTFPYNERKVRIIMNECTLHMNLVRLPPDNPDMLLEKFVYHVFYLSIYHLHVSSHGLIFGLVIGIIH